MQKTHRTTRDVLARQGFLLPEGSTLEQVREFKVYLRGLWCSMAGSYWVTVPKSACAPCRKECDDGIVNVVVRAIDKDCDDPMVVAVAKVLRKHMKKMNK